MTTASYIIPTHWRPKLLKACLQRIKSSPVPDGWNLEIVVAANPQDERGRRVAAEADVNLVLVDSPNVGAKLTAAYKASRGSLVLVTGDDDMQSPKRLSAAIALHVGGAEIVGLRRFRFLELATGKVAMWDGPAAKVGAARSFRRHLLDSVGGWLDIPKGVDTDLACRMESYGMYPYEVQLPEEISRDTICTQHGANIWRDREFPDKGITVPRGQFKITGEGIFFEISDFPEDVIAGLELYAPDMPPPRPVPMPESDTAATRTSLAGLPPID